MTDRTLYKNKNKNREIKIENDNEVFIYNYEYIYNDGTVKKFTKKYLPSEDKKIRKKINDIIEKERTFNFVRKMIARTIQYKDINIDKNIINNPSKNRSDVCIIEEVIYFLQGVEGYNAIILLLEYIKNNKFILALLREKDIKLYNDLNNIAIKIYGIQLEDVVK